jgi:hypothetical protein
MLTSCTILYSSRLLLYSSSSLLYSSSLLLQLQNSTHLYRHSTDTHRTSRDRYPPCITKDTSHDHYPLLLCDVTAHAQAVRTLHSNGPHADTKKALLQYCWPHVCCGCCLAMGQYVTIRIPFSLFYVKKGTCVFFCFDRACLNL